MKIRNFAEKIKMMDIDYNTPFGFFMEIEQLRQNDLVFYYNWKDYWTDMLISLVKKPTSINEELIKNVIAMIKFCDWHVYLYKHFIYLKKGVEQGIFEANKPISQCNIDLDWINYRSKFYKGLKIKIKDNSIELLDEYSVNYTILDYCFGFDNYTLLDIAIALHSGISIQSQRFINDALSLGATLFNKKEYDIPVLDNSREIPVFKTQNFCHLEKMASVTSNKVSIHREDLSDNLYRVNKLQ